MTRILVTGASGNVGRELLDQLGQLPAADVRAFSRRTGGDLSRPESLRDALDGVD
ncbi:NAD-dependent epimerase/dehydratase family protein [Kribbella sp. NPDC023855]|uniref:NAD-dependent epimerase/dehydratase family protein n=1 Tax=Kribbella sp. NPDC023855 TaxID=3154698 RepID=UPI0033DECCAD